MAWNPAANWSYTTPKRGKGQDQWNKPKPKKDTAAPTHIGYDGRRVALHTTSQPSSSAAPNSNTEVLQLKEMIKSMAAQNMANLTPDQQRLLEPSPGEVLRSRQKDINTDRKKFNKQRNLENRVKENEMKYNKFLEDQRQLLRQERDRFQEEDQRLRQMLEALSKEEEDMEMEPGEEIDQILFAARPRDADASHLEERLVAAEKTALDAQQAMLMMSSQMQQMMAYHMGQATTHPAPQVMEEPLRPQMTPHNGHPGNGFTKTTSPQMPKVRQNALKQNGKQTPAKVNKPKATATPTPEGHAKEDGQDGMATAPPAQEEVVDLEADAEAANL